jgi:hypothetical protein
MAASKSEERAGKLFHFISSFFNATAGSGVPSVRPEMFCKKHQNAPKKAKATYMLGNVFKFMCQKMYRNFGLILIHLGILFPHSDKIYRIWSHFLLLRRDALLARILNSKQDFLTSQSCGISIFT